MKSLRFGCVTHIDEVDWHQVRLRSTRTGLNDFMTGSAGIEEHITKMQLASDWANTALTLHQTKFNAAAEAHAPTVAHLSSVAPNLRRAPVQSRDRGSESATLCASPRTSH